MQKETADAKSTIMIIQMKEKTERTEKNDGNAKTRRMEGTINDTRSFMKLETMEARAMSIIVTGAIRRWRIFFVPMSSKS